MHQQFYNATMDILGDPALNPLDNIAVEISTPGGKLHYSSGWWTVQNVTHTISSTGSFTSRVTLFRPAHGADGPGQVSPSTTKSLTDVSNAQVEE
jgi:hypothetical protein